MITHRIAIFLASLAASAAAQAAPEIDNPRDTTCRVIRGTLVPECNAAICNQGSIAGDLRGHYSSRVTSIYPSGSGWIYTSWMRIELEGGKGRVETLDEGTAPRDAQGGPDLSQGTQVLTISDATGAYQDHSGTIVVVGAHALGRPTPYAGRICRHVSPQ
jgi:hypothetical protein